MNCDFIMRHDIAERYLLGELSDAEQEDYERHFFECSRCAEELKLLQTLQVGLRESGPALQPSTPRSRWDWSLGWGTGWRWAAVTAVAASIVGLPLLLRPSERPEPHARTLPDPAGSHPAALLPSGAPVDSTPTQVAGQSDGASSRPNADEELSDVRAALRRLARVAPPTYRPVVLRGATDEAPVRFRDGMQAYVAGDYRAAARELEQASTLDPGRPDMAFFLGVSHLLVGDPAAGARELQRTVAMGETPFLQEAHFYLAKAHLARGDVAAARISLEMVVQLRGEMHSEAVELLGELDRLDWP